MRTGMPPFDSSIMRCRIRSICAHTRTHTHMDCIGSDWIGFGVERNGMEWNWMERELRAGEATRGTPLAARLPGDSFDCKSIR